VEVMVVLQVLQEVVLVQMDKIQYLVHQVILVNTHQAMY
tara:strand:+ start:76 stop:192 length:117 start_codon:yes stop_codon:yes gene_type:complete